MITGYVTTAIIAAAIAATAAWQTQNWRHDAIELARVRVEARDQVKRIEHVDVAAVKHETFKAKEEVRYVERTKIVDRIVDRPVYRNACFDDDGLQQLNAAIAGRDPASEPAPTVPRSAAPVR